MSLVALVDDHLPAVVAMKPASAVGITLVVLAIGFALGIIIGCRCLAPRTQNANKQDTQEKKKKHDDKHDDKIEKTKHDRDDALLKNMYIAPQASKTTACHLFPTCGHISHNTTTISGSIIWMAAGSPPLPRYIC
jgi:hypothetical protein